MLMNGFAFEDVAGLDSGMGVASGAAAGRDLGDAGDRDVAFGEFHLLQRGALDARLLRQRGTGKGDDDQSQEQDVSYYWFPPCREPSSGAFACGSRAGGALPGNPAAEEHGSSTSRGSGCGRPEVMIICAPGRWA